MILWGVTFQAVAAGAPRIGAPQKIVEFPTRGFVTQENVFNFSPHPDGKRFLISVTAAEEKPELHVVTNWQKGGGATKR